MSKIPLKIKTSFQYAIQICALFLLIGAFSPVSGLENYSGSDSTRPWYAKDQVSHKIVSFLSTYHLPLFAEGESTYTLLGYEHHSFNTAYVFGKAAQDKIAYTTMFSVKRPWLWGDIETHLDYITTDAPISPTLFNDVVLGATPLLPKTLSDFHVLIQKLGEDHFPKKSTHQVWTFFNSEADIQLLVTLTEDGRGGMYFDVQRP